MATAISEREYDAKRKAAKRASDRDLSIPVPLELNRRRDCLADIYLFLQTYFGDIFSQPFTAARRTMVDALRHAARYGGDQSIAGPRGDGKTRSALFGSFALELEAFIRFPLLISKSGPRAHRELRNLKDAIRDSSKFRDDFPELCIPILDACRWPSKARLQTAHGQFVDMEWGEEAIIFPTVPTELLREHAWKDLPEDILSVADGQIMASLGIEGPIRGYSIRNQRPDVAIFDDIDDRESARSTLQTETRTNIIEEDAGGLGGPDRTVSRLMLCTLLNTTCIAAVFTDPKKKPSWRPQRHKLLTKLPTNMELWDEYINLRCGRADDDPDARKAHEHYKTNREAMDAGAEVSNPYRFDGRILADGEPSEISALQSCFNIIADRGWEHFNTEYQNDPPEEEGPQESGITQALITSRLHDYPHRTIPNGSQFSIAIDLGDHRCHWTAVAADAHAAEFIIDYGFQDVFGTSPEDMDPEVRKLEQGDHRKRLAVQKAIYKTLETFREQIQKEPYAKEDGEVVEPSIVLIDSSDGDHQRAVYQFCQDYGSPFVPAKGFGESKFRIGSDAPGKRKCGESWAKVKQQHDQWRNTWLHEFDSDYWKRHVHQRFLTPTLDDDGRYRTGSISLWRDTQSHRHAKFARQNIAEIWTKVFVPGKGEKSFFDKRSKENHWQDSTAMACVGLSMAGVRVIGSVRKRSYRPMSEMQAEARK